MWFVGWKSLMKTEKYMTGVVVVILYSFRQVMFKVLQVADATVCLGAGPGCLRSSHGKRTLPVESRR